MLVYKLTDQNFKTFNDTIWGENVTHKTSGESVLCTDGWLHYYHHPILAILLNPIHANIENPILWKAKAEGKHLDDHGLKGGCTKLTTIKQITIPIISPEQKIKFAILSTKKVCNHHQWNQWADNWLSGKDRSKKSAKNACLLMEHMHNSDDVAQWISSFAASHAAQAVIYMNNPLFDEHIANSIGEAARAAHFFKHHKLLDTILKQVFH